VTRTFSVLHARAFCHATEDLERVKTVMMNAFGEVELAVSRTEGHHGNPITILETTIKDPQEIDHFLARLDLADIETLIDTLDKRVDNGCNLFIKLDKQEAFTGVVRLGAGDDVISVRLKIRSFPAKVEVAKAAARQYLMKARRSEARGHDS